MKHFVFLDDSNPPRPFLCAEWGQSWWLFYLHANSKEWVSLRKINDPDSYRHRALPPEQAKLYPGLK